MIRTDVGSWEIEVDLDPLELLVGDRGELPEVGSFLMTSDATAVDHSQFNRTTLEH